MKGAAAERKLAAIAGENIETNRRERQDQKRNENRTQEVFAAKRPYLKRVEQRHADEGEPRGRPIVRYDPA